MLISVNGWGRDHGTREIIEGDLAKAEVKTGYSKQEVYMQVVRTTAGSNGVISKGASLKLNGDYVVHAELSQEEIARLFYLTHSDKDLRDLIDVFAEFKQEQDKAEAEAEAKRQEAAKRTIMRR